MKNIFSTLGKCSRLVFHWGARFCTQITLSITNLICHFPKSTQKNILPFPARHWDSEIKPNKVNCWLKPLAGHWRRPLSIRQSPVALLLDLGLCIILAKNPICSAVSCTESSGVLMCTWTCMSQSEGSNGILMRHFSPCLKGYFQAFYTSMLGSCSEDKTRENKVTTSQSRCWWTTRKNTVLPWDEE